MRIAVAADEPYPVHTALLAEIAGRGHEILPYGAFATGDEGPWADIAGAAARTVADGSADEGIFLCWTGTGMSMAANKVPGIRAALCTDAGTAAGARVWNHANVLCLSHRLLTDDLAREILAAWFDTPRGDRGSAGVDRLRALESAGRSR